jgi:hypothetical protein
VGDVRPSAPLPSRVYWRRRLVVLGIPVLLVVLAVWFVGGRGAAHEPTGAATHTNAATAKATANATTKATVKATARATSTSTVSVPDCSSLDLDVSADAKAYDAGENPKLITTITNTGAKACLVDAGSAHTALVITSGDDEVWSSRHCASKASASKPLLLSSGKSVSESVMWERVRSTQGCPSNPHAAKAGTYAVTYSVAGQNAAPAVIRLR